MSRSVYKYAVIQNLLITVNTAGTPAEEDWNNYLTVLRTQPITKYLGASIGNVDVSSVRRKQSSELLKANGVRTAVVTDDTVVRGLVTAMSWLGTNMNAFSWGDMKSALKYLDVAGDMAEKAEATIFKLRAEAEMKAR